MAVNVVTQPLDWNSCYVPLRYTFSSTLNPVLTTFTASLGSFLYPSTAQLAQYPQLRADKIIVRSAINVQSGNYIEIEDIGEFNSLNPYKGRFLVLNKFGTDIVQIDAAFTTNILSNLPPLYNPFQYIKVKRVYNNHVIKAALYLTSGNATFAVPTASTQKPIYTFELRVNKTTANAWVEVQEMLAKYMREYLPELNNTFQTNVNADNYIAANYFVRVWEEWDDLDTNFNPTRQYSLPVALPARLVIDAIVPHVQEKNFDVISNSTNLNDFRGQDLTPNKRFLTNSPKTIDIEIGEQYFLFFATSLGMAARRARIREYSSNGTLLATTTTQFRTNVIEVFSVGTSAFTLNSNTAYYLVDVVQTISNFSISETIRFNIKQANCLNNSGIRLYWKNLRGGIDAFTFNGKIDNVEQVVDGYTHTGFKDIVRKTKQRDVVAQTSSYGKTFELNSGFVTPEVANWLGEIAIRKSVYIELDGNYYPINILSGINLPSSKNKTFNVTLKCEFAWRDKVQMNNYDRLDYVYNNGVLPEPTPVESIGGTRG